MQFKTTATTITTIRDVPRVIVVAYEDHPDLNAFLPSAEAYCVHVLEVAIFPPATYDTSEEPRTCLEGHLMQ